MSRPVARGRVVEVAGFVLLVGGIGLWMIKPVGDQRLTVIAYVCVIAGAIGVGLARGRWIDPMLGFAAIAVLTIGVTGVVHGLIERNPGALSEAVFFVLLPAAWFVIATGFTAELTRLVVNLIPWISLIIAGLGIAYWLYTLGFPGVAWTLQIRLGQSSGLESDRTYGTELHFDSMSSLIFILPFLIFSLIVKGTYSWLLSRIAAWPALAATLLFVFVSGRRVLFVSTVVAVLFGFLFLLTGPAFRAVRRRFAIIGGITALLAVVVIIVSRFSPSALVASVLEDALSPDSLRSRSSAALLESWSRSPLYGNGLGDVVSSMIRNPERPWNNELQYHLLLNTLGIAGLLPLAALVAALFWLARSEFRAPGEGHPYLAALVVGTAGALFANATNPYLHTPAQLWMLFLLVVALNAARRPERVPGLARTTLRTP